MKYLLRCHIVAAALAGTAVLGCATTTTTSRTWTTNTNRAGTVESVQEIVQRVEGNPAAGAVTGALLGGFLFRGTAPATVIGATAGAAVGAAASQGVAETRSYDVLVSFDDGSRGVFVFGESSPFRPGDRVLLTPRGLQRL